MHADLGTHSAHCTADRGDLTVTVLQMVVDAPVAVWSLRSGSFGFVQFLDKVAVPVGATTGGRAMLGSTMDTCPASSRGFWKNFMIFYVAGCLGS